MTTAAKQKRFKLNQQVEWSSHSGTKVLFKRGRVVYTAPKSGQFAPGGKTGWASARDRAAYQSLSRGSKSKAFREGEGATRALIVIGTDGRYYTPRTSGLYAASN